MCVCINDVDTITDERSRQCHSFFLSYSCTWVGIFHVHGPQKKKRRRPAGDLYSRKSATSCDGSHCNQGLDICVVHVLGIIHSCAHMYIRPVKCVIAITWVTKTNDVCTKYPVEDTTTLPLLAFSREYCFSFSTV